jgi:hypothetical protein
MKKTLPSVVLGVALLLLLNKKSHAQSILDNSQIRFFTHTEYSLSSDSNNRVSNTFEIGDMEMLLTSQITDRISLLAEPVFTPDDGLELDRVMIKYSFNDYFNVSAGKLYSPIGIWNTTFYHQARVLTPTIDHPVVIADGSDFGVLNNKDVGLQLSGENISKLRLGYKLMVSNGYTGIADFASNAKSYTGNIFIEPIDNLKFAVSAQAEELAGGMTNAQGVILAKKANYSLINAGIMYLGGGKKLEFASEYFMANTQTDSIGSGNFSGAFAYLGYKIKKITPYVMYNYVNYDKNIVWFTKNNFTGATIGGRYNLSPLCVLKVEAQFLEAEEFKKLNRFEVMWAIGF